MRRRPKRPGKYSLSCTDEDWERIKARASHAGMSVSAFIVEAARAIGPTRPRMDVARVMEQHRATAEAARRVIAHLPPVPPETAPPLWKALHGRVLRGDETSRAVAVADSAGSLSSVSVMARHVSMVSFVSRHQAPMLLAWASGLSRRRPWQATSE